MMDFLKNYRLGVFIFLIAVIVRLLAFGVLSHIAETRGVLTTNPDRYAYPIIGIDGGGYVGTARVLLAEGRFASMGVAEPQSYQMPGYPIFLAAIFAMGGGVNTVVILQILFAGLSAVLIYYIGKEIAPRVGKAASFIFAVEPISVFYSTTILTETLFVFLLLLSVYIYLRKFNSLWSGMLVSGITLGLATLIRPSSIVLPAIFVALVFIIPALLPLRKKALFALVFLAGFSMMVFPWSLRNKIIFNTWELTAVATIQWYGYNAPLYYAFKHGVTHSEAQELFRERLLEINPYKSDAGTLYNTPYMRQVAFEYLKQDPLGYAGFHAVKSVPFFLSDGLRDIARRMDITGKQPDIGSSVLRRDWKGLFTFFSEDKTATFLLIFGSAFWAWITLGILVSAFSGKSLTSEGKRALYLSILFILATALVAAGPNASARYRLSVSPFMFIAASYGLHVLILSFKRTLKF